MYSYEERKKAVEAYIKNDCNAKKTVEELGYPTRTTLENWYWELIRTGQLKEKFIRAREYSEEQRREAVEYYFVHGLSLTKTIRELALPIKREALRSWIKEFEPERELNCKRAMPLVQCTQEQKEEAVAAVLCTRGKTGQEIAEEYGVSRAALYKWRRRFLAGEGEMAMPKTDEETRSLEEKNAELLKELQRVTAIRGVLGRGDFNLAHARPHGGPTLRFSGSKVYGCHLPHGNGTKRPTGPNTGPSGFGL